MSQTVTHAKRSPKTARAGRTLQLANPHLTGDDVKQAQELLTAGPYGNFEPGTIDGEYGPATAEAVKQAKWLLGYPAKACDDSFGPQLATILKTKKLPPAYQVRRRQRLKEAAHQASVRGRIVELARWGIQNEHAIHYQQLRPLDGLNQPQKLPLYTDCSGFSTLCYKWAGSQIDPNGANFCGAYTGTMLTHCRHIPRRAVQPGDLVVWGAYPGHHVALVLEPGSDPLLCSHGQEKGPLAIRFSTEGKYQPTPATWLACLP
jgi:cell wall-associated NlpC family hydrolase